MSNIEASPEGFNMLRRMYETVQEPLLNATTMTGNTGSDSSNPFAALLGAQGGNQTGDGLTNSSTTVSENTTGSPSPNANPLPNPWAPAATAGGAQTNNVRSSPGGGPRPQTPAPLGGLGLPDFESMLGTMPNTNALNQLMQNPAISQMMQSVISNPQYMNQIMNTNPQISNLLNSNPQLREMMLNPEFLRQLTNPETMQQMLNMQSLMSGVGRQQTTQEQGQTGGATGPPNNMGLDMLMNMFGGLGAGSLAPTSNEPPEQLYATQLSQLQEMGFFDPQENIRALVATAGNVHAAVERLLGNLGQ
jgi:ubiquilin